MIKKLFSKKIGILFLFFLLFSLVAYIVYLYAIENFVGTQCPTNPNPNFKTCPYPPVRGSGEPDPTCPQEQYSKITGGPCSKINNTGYDGGYNGNHGSVCDDIYD